MMNEKLKVKSTTVPEKALPSEKDIVSLLCSFIREEDREVIKNSIMRKQKYLVYQCPKKDQCIKKHGEIAFQKGKGWTNPCSHLKTCLCHGKMSELYDMYDENIDRKQHDISSFFTPILKVSTKEQAIYDWIVLIVEESLPISITKKQAFRRFKDEEINFSQEKVKETLYKLVELVEHRIAQNMKMAGRGSILHDGWSKNGVHYVAIYGCFMKEVSEFRNHKKIQYEVPELVLLACSPMASLLKDDKDTLSDNEGDKEDEKEAVKFTAEVHANFIKETFKYYDRINFKEWTKAQTADNVAVNRKIAELLGINHIPCKSHLLNSEVGCMTNNLPELQDILESVQTTMRQCKKSLKNAAVLRNLSTLKPIMYNKTRWSGKHDVLKRFIEIREDLIKTADDENTSLEVNSSIGFLNKVKKHQKTLARIQIATKELQTQFHSLSSCRADLDLLLEDVSMYRNQIGHNLFQCKLGKKYIGSHSGKLHNIDFENGVVKLQNDEAKDMSPSETEECSVLRLVDCDTDKGNLGDSDDVMTYQERRDLHKKKRRLDNHKYGNLDFILGSAAVVERLWSIADKLIDGDRNNTSPLLMEALLFLRENRSYWDLPLVCEAFNAMRSQIVTKKMEEEEAYEKEV